LLFGFDSSSPRLAEGLIDLNDDSIIIKAKVKRQKARGSAMIDCVTCELA